MRTLKYSAIAVLLVTLTGVIGVLYATQWMSPNRLKPLLIGIFEGADIRLELADDLRWQLGSSIQFEFGQVAARTESGSLNADSGHIQLALWPLLQGRLVIDQLGLVRPTIQIRRASSEGSTPQIKTSVLLKALTIEDGQIDGLPGNLLLSRANLHLARLASNEPSTLTVNAIAETKQLRFPINGQAQVRSGLNEQSLTLTDIRLQSRQAELTIDGYITLASNGDVAGEGWAEIPVVHLRQWLSIAGVDLPTDPSQQSFRQFSVQGAYQIDGDGVRFEPIEGQLDDGRFTAQATWLFDRGYWNVSLDLDTLAWPVAPQTDDATNHSQNDRGLLLPSGNYAVRVKQFRLGNRQVDHVKITVGVDADQITIGQLNAALYFGELEASGTWVPATGSMSWVGTYANGSLASMPLGSDLAGQLSLQFDVEWSTGLNQPISNMLTGSIRGNLTSASLKPFDPSLAWCDALRQPLTPTIRFQDALNIRLNVEQGVAQFDILDGVIGGLNVTGSGRSSLVSGALQTSLNTAVKSGASLSRCPLFVVSEDVSTVVNCRMNIQDRTSDCTIREADQVTLASLRTIPSQPTRTTASP